jgi:hypothetical protein
LEPASVLLEQIKGNGMTSDKIAKAKKGKKQE